MYQFLGRFAVRQFVPIVFLVLVLSLAGGYAAMHMPSSVFPQTDFPRVVIMAQNGMTPADEMMATVTRPLEEAMKDIQGCRTIRSSTGRGSAQINLFFDWNVDMRQAELYVLGRLAQIRDDLPPTADASVYRMTFSTFPIAGISLTRPPDHNKEPRTERTRAVSGDVTVTPNPLTPRVRSVRGSLETGDPTTRPDDRTADWEFARYDIKPRLLRIPGVARVELVGGAAPEYAVIVDPLKLSAADLSLADVTTALLKNNLVSASGIKKQDYMMMLTAVDGRLRSVNEIENFTVPAGGTPLSAGGQFTAINAKPVAIKEFATVRRQAEPSFQAVTADGTDSVLLNVFAQPDGSTLEIADQLKAELASIQQTLPAGIKLSFFYDQSLLVRSSVRGVWEAIGFGLLLSLAIVLIFLRDWRLTLVATLVIPVTVLFTTLAMKLLGQSFNLMTLGGIAAAIGLVIDDAIVVVEAICVKLAEGVSTTEGVETTAVETTAVVEMAVGEILPPLLGSTLTPVVVFVPLAFLTGIAGVFFRALAVTMVVALITSLLLAVTLTPTLAARLVRGREQKYALRVSRQSLFMSIVIWLYESTARVALRNRLFVVALCLLVLVAAGAFFSKMRSDFLPATDEGGFVIDYIAPPGTSLDETDRQMRIAEQILLETPEVESYSRRTGAALGVHLVEPNTGDFLVKLKDGKRRPSEVVITELRTKFKETMPRIQWEFPGILTDLIGDLTWSDEAIGVKLLSNDLEFLKRKAPQIEKQIQQVNGVVDTSNGLIYTGTSIHLRVRHAEAQRLGLSTTDIATAVNIAMLGKVSSNVLEADRVINIRVVAEPVIVEHLGELPLRAKDGSIIRLDQVTDVEKIDGQLELQRDDLRQNVTISANLENRDLGTAMKEIRRKLDADPTLPPGSVEYGGLYEQQQESFAQLRIMLAAAVTLVFVVALLEFGSFRQPIAIVFGAVTSLFGITLALMLTGATLNIVTFLGAIIGMGIVHKNGLLMLDHVVHLQRQGLSVHDALIFSGRRRLRPVLMTSLAAALGMLPLAWGIGSANMLRPMAVAVIGAVVVSVLLSLIATPVVYSLLSLADDDL